MKQYVVLLQISLASLRRAHWASLTIVMCVAVVVLVLQGFLAMIAGFEQSAKNTGAADVAVVLDAQATSENSSNITREQLEIIKSMPALRGPDGRAHISPELTAIVGGSRAGDKVRINMTLRGLGKEGIALRRGFQLLQGRLPAPASREIIVGRRLMAEVEGLALNHSIRLGSSDWRVVGVFALEGNLFESEIWSDLASVQDAFNRANQYQAIRIGLPDAAALAGAAAQSSSDPRLGLQLMSEHEYLQAQASSGVFLAQYFGWPLALMLALGVVAGIYNVIQISIQGRSRANRILGQLGFGRWPLFASLLSESVLLSLLGAALGSLLAYVLIDGLVTSTLSVGFTTRTFSLRLQPHILLQAVLLATAIGICGGIRPAWQGSASTAK